MSSLCAVTHGESIFCFADGGSQDEGWSRRGALDFITSGKGEAKYLGWRLKSWRGQPVVDLSGNIDLRGFSQQLRAANAGRHCFGLQAQTGRLLREAICEWRCFSCGRLSRHF